MCRACREVSEVCRLMRLPGAGLSLRVPQGKNGKLKKESLHAAPAADVSISTLSSPEAQKSNKTYLFMVRRHLSLFTKTRNNVHENTINALKRVIVN